jgi:hypothetical protein
MEFINRKVFLTKYLRPLDTNGDGIFNALVLSATTKTIQVPLRHSFDDMGTYEVSDEESFEIIDIGGMFDDGITGVTQPPDGPGEVTGTTWDGGGTSGNGGTNENEIKYCNDLTAINGTSLTYDGSKATLTPNDGSPTTYDSPLPTFTITNTLCEYTVVDNGGGGSGTVGSSTIKGQFHIYNWNKYTTTVCEWTESTWSSFTSTARDYAKSYCVNQFGSGYRVVEKNDLYFNGQYIGGGSCTDDSAIFYDVKLWETKSGSCCKKRDEDGICTKSVTKYRHKYCFYCIK